MTPLILAVDSGLDGAFVWMRGVVVLQGKEPMRGLRRILWTATAAAVLAGGSFLLGLRAGAPAPDGVGAGNSVMLMMPTRAMAAAAVTSLKAVAALTNWSRTRSRSIRRSP